MNYEGARHPARCSKPFRHTDRHFRVRLRVRRCFGLYAPPLKQSRPSPRKRHEGIGEREWRVS